MDLGFTEIDNTYLVKTNDTYDGLIINSYYTKNPTSSEKTNFLSALCMKNSFYGLGFRG